MGDTEALSKQITKMMEMMQSMNAKIDDNMKTQSANMKTLQERMVRHEITNEDRGKTIKFSPEELSEVEILSGSKGSKGAISFDTRAGTSFTPSKAEKDIPVRSGGLAHESNYGFSGGPWPNRAVGRERGHMRTDGGGDWNVRPIGAAPRDSHPNCGDYRNSEGLMEGGYYETREDRSNNFERRCVKAAKIEFQPFDGTTDAMEWLQKICKSQFGKADAVNPVGELSNLRHTGTVDEYCSQFEECLNRQTRLSGDQQLWQFCAGLTDSLRKEVEYLRPETIFEAIEYARDNEYKIDNDKRTRTFGGHLAPITKTLGVSARQENRHHKKTLLIPTDLPTDTKVVGHLRRNTDKFPTKSKKMKSSEFRRPFPTEFRRHTVRRNFPTTFRRHSDKKCNRCSRRKFVGIFRRNSDDIPINSKVVGIPSVFSDGIPTNHVTVADKYI
ncbi:hypothetical protein F2Q68_00025086 [Brassica cretica]|uniref:Retrotransposon gag domain-containing protein n=1 Tax=Brassica cretica TaxID=69181 RepID=A0A8S9IFQ7_BRACR|nr:hypothetical protein F2Q68_00025086 [Brassica cretica]